MTRAGAEEEQSKSRVGADEEQSWSRKLAWFSRLPVETPPFKLLLTDSKQVER